MTTPVHTIAAARRVVDSLVAPGHALPAADADTLATLGAAAFRPLEGGERVLVVTGVLLAQLYSGRREAALELADAVADSPDADAPHVSALLRSALHAAVAEAYATAGRARPGYAHARRASTAADAADDDASRFRAAAIACVSAATNGDYRAASREAAAARALAEGRGWMRSFVAYPLLLGETLIASAEFRRDRLVELTADFRARPADARWSSTAHVVASMAALIEGDTGASVAFAMHVVGGVADVEVLPMIRGFGLGVLADALLVRGEPERVLTVLADAPSPPGHALCFAMQRASAHLACDDPLAALRATSGCLTLGAEHSMRTLGPVLLRRALAHRRLGDIEIAASEFEHAFRMIALSASGTPLLTLPSADLRWFFADLLARRPELSASVADIEARLQQLPVLVERKHPMLPALTRREGELAWGLRDGLSVAELGRAGFVSVNTIKTQLRMLYAKLGVRSRADAVAMLERAGSFDRPRPADRNGATRPGGVGGPDRVS